MMLTLFLLGLLLGCCIGLLIARFYPQRIDVVIYRGQVDSTEEDGESWKRG